MKKLFLTLAFIFASLNAQAACDIKGIVDPQDGAVFYTKEHRLYGHVDLKKSAGSKTFCSVSDAERAGFRPASKYFSNSTARVVECVEGSDSKCKKYVLGIYKSLDMYGQLCGAAGASQEQVLGAFIARAKASEKNMDIAKYYGTTNALLEAYPCGVRRIAQN